MCQFVAYVLRPLNLAPIFYVFLFRRLCYAFIAIRTYVLHYLKFGAHDLLPKTTPKQYTCCTLRPLNWAPMFYDPLIRCLCSTCPQFAYVLPLIISAPMFFVLPIWRLCSTSPQFSAYVLRLLISAPMFSAPMFCITLNLAPMICYLKQRLNSIHVVLYVPSIWRLCSTTPYFVACVLRPVNLVPMFDVPLFRRLCSTSLYFGAYVLRLLISAPMFYVPSI